MKRFFVWYLPQAAFFCGTFWLLASITSDAGERPNIAAMLIVSAMVAAAYTGGANLVMDISSWLVRRLRRHNGKPSGDGLSLIGTGRSSGETAEHAKRIGVRE